MTKATLREVRRENRGPSGEFVVNVTSLSPPIKTPHSPENLAKNYSSQLTIGTILAIMLFTAVICYYVYQLQSPRYRRRFGRSSRSHRRSVGRRSENLRTQRSVRLGNFEGSVLPRYESVVFLNINPPPYEFPPSYEEVMAGQVTGNIPQDPSGSSTS